MTASARMGRMPEDRSLSRRERDLLERENAQWPLALREIPRADFPDFNGRIRAPLRAWRSRDYLVQLYDEGNAEGVLRLTINSTHAPTGRDWTEGLTWDDLQRLKREAGYAERTAVEVFPPDEDIVNDANMRHIWLLPEPLAWAWTAGNRRTRSGRSHDATEST